MYRTFLTSLLVLIGVGAFAQDSTLTYTPDTNEDTLTYERFLAVVENSLFEYYKETWGKERAYEIIDSLGYEDKDRPTFSDSVYIARLNDLNRATPIDIEINDELLSVVKYFAAKRRRFTAVCIGRSKLFFPMYEEYLDKYEMPLELKYLSVIESGLRPTVKSRVGATGLWQFMYRTGKSFGLDNDSYIDERMDPELATDAACRYLKYLHGLYGDWSMALAAYNAGPGNVNKAIRRSGGQMHYWGIRPYLPKETQMYVPNFIAMMYMMTYYAEHNIIPREAKVYDYEVDTVCITKSIRISHVDSLVGIPTEDFLYLNPVYKTDIIPETDPCQCITLPIDKIDDFLALEDSLYRYEETLDSIGMSFVALEKKKIHTVKPGETLPQIAQQYDVTVDDIRGWNDMKKSDIYPGQRLTIRVTERKLIESTQVSSTRTSSSSSGSYSKPKTTNDGKYKYYSLKQGESLWTVSQKFGISFDKLQEWNKGIDPTRMQPGDKIIIGVL